VLESSGLADPLDHAGGIEKRFLPGSAHASRLVPARVAWRLGIHSGLPFTHHTRSVAPESRAYNEQSYGSFRDLPAIFGITRTRWLRIPRRWVTGLN
jgi:hypothetical protein